MCLFLLISFCLSVFFRLFDSVSVSVCPSVCFCLSVFLFASFCLSVCVLVCLSVCPYVCLSVRMSVCLSVRLFVCLPVRLSVYLSVCLSVHLSSTTIYLYFQHDSSVLFSYNSFSASPLMAQSAPSACYRAHRRQNAFFPKTN